MSPEFNWYSSQKPSDREKLLHIPPMKQKLSLIYIITACHCIFVIKYDGLFISPPNVITPGIPSQLIFFSLRAKPVLHWIKPLLQQHNTFMYYCFTTHIYSLLKWVLKESKQFQFNNLQSETFIFTSYMFKLIHEILN